MPRNLALRGALVVIAISASSLAAGAHAAGAAGRSDAALKALYDEMWEYGLSEDPLMATNVGDHRFDDKLPGTTLADGARRHARDLEFQQRLAEIARGELSPANQVNYDILARQLGEDIAEYDFQGFLIPITNREGFHVQFPELRREVPLATVRDYENYIARLAAFDAYAAGYIERMRAGVKAGHTLPAVILAGWEAVVEPHIVDNPEDSLLYEPLRKFPPGVPEAEHARLRAAAQAAIRDAVVAGYRQFRDFMRDEYVPAARTTIGASALPNGREYYKFRVKKFTTLELTPEQVHQIGLDEVKRIRGEMEAVMRRTGFAGDFAAFVEHLRTDPKFYATTPEELMRAASYHLKQMDGELPKLFGKLPRMPYGLRPIPDYIAPRTSSAYYQPPAGDGTRAGFFYLNTYNLPGRPLFALESLAAHEAVPGHHLQIALQQEITDLPNFRRFSGFTAFVEGWGLYAERLAGEAGFYADPYSEFGRLSMEMWRACRLVVDTGMHDFDWPRERAIAYMAENSAESMHNIEAEIDRYIGWPGQALAYKMGELKIRELRARAERELGPRFDIRAFHDAVLGGGSVPLDVLERQIDAWIAAQRATPGA
jgi:uncharacterized protein (DUF885 family)